MKIISMQIENVLGIKEFSLDAGQITEISGRNAEGKTSILTALQTAIGGGSLTEIKNINTDDKARIVLALRDESGTNYVLDKTESSLKLKKQVGDTAAFESVGKPQNFLNTLRDCKLQNPMDFLNCKDKERVDMILQAIELPFSTDELWEAIGFPRDDFGFVANGMNPLNEIATVRQMVFEKRTGVNTSRRDKRAACEESRLSVPAEIPNIEGIVDKEKELSDLRVKMQEMKTIVDNEKKTSISDAEKLLSDTVSAVESESKSFVEVLEKQFVIDVQQIREGMNERILKNTDNDGLLKKSARTHRDDAISFAIDNHTENMAAVSGLQPEVERLTAEIATLREQEKSAVRIATIHEQADKMERDADGLDEVATRLTESLKNIDVYKASLSSDLPVEGLDMADNVVTIDGVKWGQLNTATRIVSAVKIIAARAKKYPFKFCVVDGVEALDSDSQKVLTETLLSNDIQAVLGRVTDNDMQVKK